ncbi:DUF1516 family protein [Paenibacillus doosanensis]|uniref:Uncharacterized protein n=1 Tax=Paenibacillus konkukensis TaxID=2020716 RepID=A0ABY4RRW4_9BACL|nr:MULTISPECIES: DUF1516 family protein [Paenibacillus]MCS7461275.1 DUF1516 family protein [Paenibacillus doosanensis]UQZ85284.1 hypothetical protein SK3146_04573 [Paenibacillus konkukensis]
MFNIFYQSHAGSWALMIILFILSVIFYRQKVTQMILRLFYLIMLVSGIGMLTLLGFPLLYVIKGVLAIVLIGMMEMIVARRRRQQSAAPMWIVFVILLVLIVLLGYGVIHA